MVMSSIVQYNDWLEEECGNMAREGLRTLVVGKKVLTEEQYLDFEVSFIWDENRSLPVPLPEKRNVFPFPFLFRSTERVPFIVPSRGASILYAFLLLL